MFPFVALMTESLGIAFSLSQYWNPLSPGRGYVIWWKDVERLESPASKLLRDIGIGFRSTQLYITGTMDAIRPTVQVTAEDVPTALLNSDDLSAAQTEYALG